MKRLLYVLLIIFSLAFASETIAYNKSFANKIINDYFDGQIFDRKYFIDSLPKARSIRNYEIDVNNILEPIKKDKQTGKYIYGLSRRVSIIDCNEDEDSNESLIVYTYANTLDSETSSSIEFLNLSLLGIQEKTKKDSKSIEKFIKNIISKYDPQRTTNHEYRDDKEKGILYVPIRSNINLEIRYNITTNQIYLVKINKIS
jgi:hypothetical protein